MPVAGPRKRCGDRAGGSHMELAARPRPGWDFLAAQSGVEVRVAAVGGIVAGRQSLAD